MIICKCDDHDGSDDDLAIYYDSAIFDGVHAYVERQPIDINICRFFRIPSTAA